MNKFSLKREKNEGTIISSLHAKQEKRYWVVDSGCSHHMTGDKSEFFKLDKYDGGLGMFGDDTGAKICGIGSISFDGKHNTDDVYYVNGLRHNLLSVSHMCSKGYKLVFDDERCDIQK